MTTTIIWTIAVITGLGLLLALALYLVAQRFKVEEDPRIEEVEKAMPGANCWRLWFRRLPRVRRGSGEGPEPGQQLLSCRRQ